MKIWMLHGGIDAGTSGEMLDHSVPFHNVNLPDWHIRALRTRWSSELPWLDGMCRLAASNSATERQ
jgi:hypothetical protein